MSRLLRTVALAVALSMVVTPATAQIGPNEPTATSLYFHIFDTFNKFVINTQPLNSEFFDVGGTNFPTLSGTPANNEQVGEYDLNTIYGTSTAGPVEYNVNENGRPRFHPEQGIAADVIFDPNSSPIAYLYLDVRDAIGGDSSGMILPDFKVDITMREGDDPGPEGKLDEGALIMSGSLRATIYDGQTAGATNDGAAGASPVTEGAGWGGVLVPNADGIVELAIPLVNAQEKIPKKEAFNIRIDWYQMSSSPGFEEDQFATGYMRWALTEKYTPRIDLNIMNPIFIEFIHPQPAAGVVLIHTGVNSPWGTYDVDIGNISIGIDGPVVPDKLTKVVAQNAVVHGLHDKAAEVTYLWRFRDQGAPDGEYTITYEVDNYHRTAKATGQATFVLEGKKAYAYDESGDLAGETDITPVEESPGVGLLGAIAMLGAAVLVRRK
jgi:hypothetical protein